MNNNLKVLVFSTLKSQVTYKDDTNINTEEPIHPYLGKRWTNLLSNNSNKIDYLNSVDSKIKSFFHRYFILPNLI